MEKHNIESVPYIIHEGIVVKMDRTIKRLWILCLVLVGLLVATNVTWIVYESQFESTVVTTTQEVTQDNDGGNNIVVGGDYGEANN